MSRLRPLTTLIALALSLGPARAAASGDALVDSFFAAPAAPKSPVRPSRIVPSRATQSREAPDRAGPGPHAVAVYEGSLALVYPKGTSDPDGRVSTQAIGFCPVGATPRATVLILREAGQTEAELSAAGEHLASHGLAAVALRAPPEALAPYSSGPWSNLAVLGMPCTTPGMHFLAAGGAATSAAELGLYEGILVSPAPDARGWALLRASIAGKTRSATQPAKWIVRGEAAGCAERAVRFFHDDWTSTMGIVTVPATLPCPRWPPNAAACGAACQRDPVGAAEDARRLRGAVTTLALMQAAGIDGGVYQHREWLVRAGIPAAAVGENERLTATFEGVHFGVGGVTALGLDGTGARAVFTFRPVVALRIDPHAFPLAIQPAAYGTYSPSGRDSYSAGLQLGWGTIQGKEWDAVNLTASAGAWRAPDRAGGVEAGLFLGYRGYGEQTTFPWEVGVGLRADVRRRLVGPGPDWDVQLGIELPLLLPLHAWDAVSSFGRRFNWH